MVGGYVGGQLLIRFRKSDKRASIKTWMIYSLAEHSTEGKSLRFAGRNHMRLRAILVKYRGETIAIVEAEAQGIGGSLVVEIGKHSTGTIERAAFALAGGLG